jgi:hypothetical protein
MRALQRIISGAMYDGVPTPPVIVTSDSGGLLASPGPPPLLPQLPLPALPRLLLLLLLLLPTLLLLLLLLLPTTFTLSASIRDKPKSQMRTSISRVTSTDSALHKNGIASVK